MKHKQKKIQIQTINLIALFFLLSLFAGCTTVSRPAPSAGIVPHHISNPVGEGQGWRRIRFRMDRSDDGQTRWERDLLIAHRIIAPILKTHGQAIHLWRFHRRSADDNTGHQFSFIFYSRPAKADLINRQVMEDPLLSNMISNQLVREVLVDRVDGNTRPDIGDTSDSNWSPVMQASWPYYIMGVCRMWLEMIDQFSLQIGVADTTPLDQLVAHYTTVNEEVTVIWQQEAYHALLHHLNAIYGYTPMIYWEKHFKTF